MPYASLRPCGQPGCPTLVVKGRCQVHTQLQEQQRGSRIVRGYDKDWLKLRAWFMAQPDNQLCRLCEREGRVTRAEECDHIAPFRGIQDEKRLDPNNLQALCIQHHREKTAQQ